MNQLTVVCPNCLREGKLPETVKKLPKSVRCPSCREHFHPVAVQSDEFTAVPDAKEQLGELAKNAAARMSEKVKSAATKAKDYATSDEARAALDSAWRKAEEVGGRAKDVAAALQSGEVNSSGLPGVLARIIKILDVKFQRFYTLWLVHLLWVGYLLIATQILIFCLLSVFIPGTMKGLLHDLAAVFYSPISESESHSSSRLGSLMAAMVLLGFFGMNLRVFLEMLSVQFRIAETLMELSPLRAEPNGDHSS